MISNIGIKQGTLSEIAEQMRLVNGISFMGLPICLSYVLIFGLTGYYFHTLIFIVGLIVFSLPILLNKLVGLNFARFFITIMASVFFGIASVLLGKDLGFYLGMLVVAVPPIIVYPSIKQALFFVSLSVLILILSIIGNIFITPIAEVPFAMAIFLLNLFVVLITTITVVIVFKIELSESRALVLEKNKEMTDSINYAKIIQNTLLAQKETLIQHLPEHFVLFAPKDIVSGDFYWATEQNDKFYLAVCDSTGHGVPGAFMSLLNMGFLSEAIKEKNISEPGEIFNYVRERLIHSISKAGQQDGMDGILLCIESPSPLERDGRVGITYSAANNEPILISKNKILELPKDKMPVGKGEKIDSFKTHTVTANKGDTLYLYTDGYADQFGGPKGKKFKYKPLNELLISLSQVPMETQKEKLALVLEDWKGNLEQVDDILIVGIKLS